MLVKQDVDKAIDLENTCLILRTKELQNRMLLNILI